MLFKIHIVNMNIHYIEAYIDADNNRSNKL